MNNIINFDKFRSLKESANNTEEQFKIALEKYDIETIKSILESGFTPKYTYLLQIVDLYIHGDVDAVKYLLDELKLPYTIEMIEKHVGSAIDDEISGLLYIPYLLDYDGIADELGLSFNFYDDEPELEEMEDDSDAIGYEVEGVMEGADFYFLFKTKEDRDKYISKMSVEAPLNKIEIINPNNGIYNFGFKLVGLGSFDKK